MHNINSIYCTYYTYIHPGYTRNTRTVESHIFNSLI